MINNIQKSIYNFLKSQNSENFNKLTDIFNYIDKNTNFPYIFVSVGKVEDLSTFSNEIYLYSISISIYDKNTTNNFVISLSEEIKGIFKNIQNLQVMNGEIIDIKLDKFHISLETDNTVWKSELIYDFIVKKVTII